MATMKIEDKAVKMLIDSGASCNVLPIKFLPKGSNIKKSNHTLKMYSKSTMTAVGTSQICIVNPWRVIWLTSQLFMAILPRYLA